MNEIVPVIVAICLAMIVSNNLLTSIAFGVIWFFCSREIRAYSTLYYRKLKRWLEEET